MSVPDRKMVEASLTCVDRQLLFSRRDLASRGGEPGAAFYSPIARGKPSISGGTSQDANADGIRANVVPQRKEMMTSRSRPKRRSGSGLKLCVAVDDQSVAARGRADGSPRTRLPNDTYYGCFRGKAASAFDAPATSYVVVSRQEDAACCEIAERIIQSHKLQYRRAIALARMSLRISGPWAPKATRIPFTRSLPKHVRQQS